MNKYVNVVFAGLVAFGAVSMVNAGTEASVVDQAVTAAKAHPKQAADVAADAAKGQPAQAPAIAGAVASAFVDQASSIAAAVAKVAPEQKAAIYAAVNDSVAFSKMGAGKQGSVGGSAAVAAVGATGAGAGVIEGSCHPTVGGVASIGAGCNVSP